MLTTAEKLAREIAESRVVKWLSPGEVAKRLRVSERTVQKLCESGEMAAVRVGKLWRIPSDWLQRYLDTAYAGRRERS